LGFRIDLASYQELAWLDIEPNWLQPFLCHRSHANCSPVLIQLLAKLTQAWYIGLALAMAGTIALRPTPRLKIAATFFILFIVISFYILSILN
jgi:hypothetical protein